jgi:hypothetical protein
MKLVMVHGRDQVGQDPDALKERWLDALKTGLERAGKTLPAGTTIEMPFYAIELERLLLQLEMPLAIEANARGPVTGPEAQLRVQILEALAANMLVGPDQINREFDGEPIERGAANWPWVHAILRAVDRVSAVRARMLDSFTRDVSVYLSYPGVRKRINAFVRDAIGGEDCVVLAHSLGSVVAYNVLAEGVGLPRVPRFITVGSPLGIGAINSHLKRPLSSPACVGNWFNAFDTRDVVALNPLDANSFDVTPAVENKSDIDNFTENRHGIEGYLADAVVAGKVVEWL